MSEDSPISLVETGKVATNVQELQQKIDTAVSIYIELEKQVVKTRKTLKDLYDEISRDALALNISVEETRDMIVQTYERMGGSKNTALKMMPEQLKYKQFTTKNQYHGGSYKKEDYELLQSAEQSQEQVKKQNFELRQQLEEFKQRVDYLEKINSEEEWSDTTVVDLMGRAVPIRVVINNLKKKIVYAEIDTDYIRNKKKEQKAKEKK